MFAFVWTTGVMASGTLAFHRLHFFFIEDAFDILIKCRFLRIYWINVLDLEF